ncbi:S8 family peptidase [Endothiovibrio diazotrophicus]
MKPKILFRWLLPLGLLPLWAPPLSAGDGGDAGAYWYRNGRRVALQTVVDGRKGASAPTYRSADGGALRQPTGRLYLCVPEGWDEARIADLAARYGMTAEGGTTRVRRFRVAGTGQALSVANTLFEREGVECAAPLWRKSMRRRSLNDPLLGEQWHLDNDGSPGGRSGADLNAFEAWRQTLGAGVTVAVVDDGLELAHPDLAGNVVAAASWDYVDGDGDPTAGDHGTAVAGVAAAVGDNGAGGAGVAPAASLVGLRVLDDAGDADESAVADAFGASDASVAIFNNSWGPPDYAADAFEGPSALELSAMQQAIRDGRGGLGQIFVWAGGNGGTDDNSNLDGYANLRYTIAVTASTDQGDAAGYAEEGANLLVNAPSSGGAQHIVTTDRSGSFGYNSGAESYEEADLAYTRQFGGTSAATPEVSGVIALMLAANPALNWRDVQQVLAASAFHNDPAHARWRRNGAGYRIDEQYGFGRVDAGAAVALAEGWGASVGAEADTTLWLRDASLAIPDDDPEGVESALFVTDRVRVEFVEVTVDITHSYWGDLAIYLTSPAGTEVRLMTSRYLPAGARSLSFDHWVLGDVLHLGEAARGRWTLRVVDEEAQDQGVLVSWGIRVYGAALPAAAEALPLACDAVRLADSAAVAGAVVRLGASRHGGEEQSSVGGRSTEDFGIHLAVAAAGTVAEYLAVAEYRVPGGEGGFYRYDGSGWQAWDGDPERLEGFQAADLQDGGAGALFGGRLAAGSYRIYGGYRDGNGAVAYCPQPLVVEVTDP